MPESDMLVLVLKSGMFNNKRRGGYMDSEKQKIVTGLVEDLDSLLVPNNKNAVEVYRSLPAGKRMALARDVLCAYVCSYAYRESREAYNVTTIVPIDNEPGRYVEGMIIFDVQDASDKSPSQTVLHIKGRAIDDLFSIKPKYKNLGRIEYWGGEPVAIIAGESGAAGLDHCDHSGDEGRELVEIIDKAVIDIIRRNQVARSLVESEVAAFILEQDEWSAQQVAKSEPYSSGRPLLR